MGNTRGSAEVAFARQVAMYLCHVAFELSLGRVAAAFARDRSTVAHACHLIEDRREDKAFEHWIDALEVALRGAPVSEPRRTAMSRPPDGSKGRLAARCDASRRMHEALSKLAPTLRRVVEQAVLHEQGLEAIERAENWPPRSGKIALKLGLAQLAQQRG